MTDLQTPLPSLPGWRFHRMVMATDFSDIWLAEDLALGRAVAIKVFAPKPGESGSIPPFSLEEWRRRFIQEARLLARLDHPHIMPVVMLGQLEDGRPCMGLQYMSGSLRSEIGVDIFDPVRSPSLSEAQRPKPVSVARAHRVLMEVLSALVEIHDKGIVHRDLKPHNLLLVDGPGSRIKLADFGMAKLPDEPVSSEGLWIGTRDYISPEQYANATLVTDRADMFSLGVIGIRMVTGAFPDPERLRAVDGLPAAFGDLLRQCLDWQPDRRPSALEMASRLAAIRL